MKNQLLRNYLYIISLIILFSFNACDEYDEPGVIFDPNASYPATPVITSVEPANIADAGVREIIIRGQNFSTDPTKNIVYFGDRRAVVKSVTSDLLTLYRPQGDTASALDDTVDIKIQNRDAPGTVYVNNYVIKKPVGAFPLDLSSISEELYALEVDNNENLYIASRRKFFKVTPDGVLSEIKQTPSSLARFTDIKYSKGYLYFTIQNKKIISRLDLTTLGDAETYAEAPQNVERFDFDDNGNIYAGQKRGLFLIKPDKSVQTTGQYDGVTINEVRVFQKSVYVADAKTLSKNVINADGTIGATEKIIDLNDFSNVDSCEIISFNFDQDGMIYLCLTGHSTHSLFVYENGSINPYYFDRILPLQVDQIVWGNTRYLYLNRGLSVDRTGVRIYRMGTSRNGAPYLGRGI